MRILGSLSIFLESYYRTLAYQRAFEDLKVLFAREPVLLHPNPDLLFIVKADASAIAVGAVLLQNNGQGTLHPCAYISRKLADTEQAWVIWEKEALLYGGHCRPGGISWRGPKNCSRSGQTIKTLRPCRHHDAYPQNMYDGHNTSNGFTFG